MEREKIHLNDELITLMITQLPNVAGTIIALAIIAYVSVKQMASLSAVIETMRDLIERVCDKD